MITYALPPRVPAWPPALLGHCRRFAHAGHSRGGWPATSGGGRNARRFTRSSVSFWRVGSSGGCCKSVASQHRWRRNCVSIWNAASSASGLRGRDVRAAAGVCGGVLVQGGKRRLAVVQWPTHGAYGRTPESITRSCRCRAAVGNLRAQSKALLPRRLARGLRLAHEDFSHWSRATLTRCGGRDM